MAFSGGSNNEPNQRRVQESPGPMDEPLQVSAAPVNTYVEQPHDDSLTQLARALSSVAPEVGRFGDMLAQKQQQDQQIKGEADAGTLALNRKTYKDAVSSGLISANSNPWYQYALNKETGRLSADKYAGDLQVAMAGDPSLQQSTKPEDFDKFEQNFRAQWMKQNGQDTGQTAAFQASFGPLTAAHIADIRTEFGKKAADNAIAQGQDLHFARTINTVVNETGRGVNPSIIAGEINQQTKQWVLNGGDGTLMNRATIDGVIAAAKRLGDPNIARTLLDEIGGGPQGSKLSMTKYGADQLDKAEKDIGNANAVQASRDAEAVDRKRQAVVSDAFSQAADALDKAGDDSHTVDLSPYVTALDKAGAGDKVSTLFSMQEAFSNRDYQDDPNVKAKAFMQVYGLDPANPDHLLSRDEAAGMLAAHQISVPTFKELTSMITDEEKLGRGKASQFANDPNLKRLQSETRLQFIQEFGFDAPENRWRALEAVDAATHDYITWHQANPNPQPDAINSFINEERNKQFAKLSPTSSIRDRAKIPAGQAGPQPVDASKNLVTDPSNIAILNNEVERWATGKRHGMSDYSMRILHDAGVPLDIKSIREFVKIQNGLAHGAVPQIVTDSTDNQQ